MSLELEKDSLLKINSVLSDIEREEILVQLEDSMEFLINETCDQFGTNHVGIEDSYIQRDIKEQTYEVGLSKDTYKASFCFSPKGSNKRISPVFSNSYKGRHMDYTYSRYPEFTLNNIVKIVYEVMERFSEENINKEFTGERERANRIWARKIIS